MFTKEAFYYEKFEKAIKDPKKQPFVRVIVEDDDEWRSVQITEINGKTAYINSAGIEVNVDNFKEFCIF